MLFLSSSLMVCPSAEQRKAKFIREPLEVSQETGVPEAKPIVAALSPTGQDTLCFTLSSVEHSVTTASSSLSTSLLISLWRTVSAEVSWLTTWPMVPSTE